MKSYTDIEQSKKAAEILLPESADMCFNISQRYNMPPLMTPYSKFNEFFNMEKTPDFLIPCWSLAALLNILPIVYINSKNEVCGPLHIDITDSETPFVLWYVNPLHKGSIVELKTKEYNNLVDACYEMIIKLHELNLL